MEYIRECIFHNKHKTLYNLFSPDPAVSCVDFISWNAHIMKHFAALRLRVSHFYFSQGRVQMGQMDLISSIFVRFFFSKLSWKHFIDHTLQMYRLIIPHGLWILPWFSNSGDTQISVYIHVPLGHAVFFKKHFGTSSVISDQASMYMCSLVGVFCSRYFSVKQLTFEICIIVCQHSNHSFI